MADEIPADEVLFEVDTPLGFSVRVTKVSPSTSKPAIDGRFKTGQGRLVA
jgi:hypothetical protein